MKITRKKLFWILDSIILIYILILLFPQFLFAKKIDYKSFTVYYHAQKINIDSLKAILDDSEKLLKNSELYDASSKQKIFLCNSFGEFTFWAPFSRKSFALNYMITQNIFISKASIAENKAFRNGKENNTRTLSSIIAHETTHSLLEDRLGTRKYLSLPTWKNEGYCDFIADESSFNLQEGKKLICKEQDIESLSFQYFIYRMITTNLFENQKMSLDVFLREEMDYTELKKNLKTLYCF